MANMIRRGVLFTTGFALLAMAALSLALMGASYHQRLTDESYYLSAQERVRNEQSDVLSDLRDIVAATSGVGIVVSKDSVSFNELLPNPSAATLQGSLDTYVSFCNLHNKNTKLRLEALRNTMSLDVLPQAVSYTHASYGGNSIMIIPTATSLNYSILVQTQANITNCTSDVPSGNGTILVEVTVLGQPGSCMRTLHTDTTSSSSVDVNGGSITIQVNPPGRLTVQNNMVGAINVTSTLYLTFLSTEVCGL